MALRQDPLVRQERRAAHEKQRERRQTDIRHRVGATVLRVLTPIRKTGTDLPKIRDEGLNRAHSASESYAEAARNPQTAPYRGTFDQNILHVANQTLSPAATHRTPKHFRMRLVRIENRCEAFRPS